MKKVIDANYFQNPALEEYLSTNETNKVVFTETACMEAYKGNALKNIYRSIEIVSRYPQQVIVLRQTREIIKLPNSSNDFENFEDPLQTQGFREFCGNVYRAEKGDVALEYQILELGEMAARHFDAIRNDLTRLRQAVEGIARSFGQKHLEALRKGTSLPNEFCERIVNDMLLSAAFLFRNNPDIADISKFHLARNNYLFRLAISCYLLILRWISKGGVGNTSKNTLNDVIDMSYVAYATFFDGLLSRDEEMQSIYQETRFLLENVFVPERN